MASLSRIEWTEATWNPVTGCTKVSPGCKHCYAENLSKRLRAMGTPGYEHGFTTVRPLPNRLDQPLKRRKPTKYFVNSMSDLFHEHIADAFLDSVFDVIARTPHHVYQILTKRAERLPRYFTTRPIPDNVWLGVSVEDQKYGKPRIDYLRQLPAKIRFLSVEPLLEYLGELDLSGIHWVIVGGESGPKARPMQPGWALDVQRQCDEAGVAFFFKQWGQWGADGKRRSKKANGRILKGTTWDQMPMNV